jgi:hypothetical protein
MPPCERCAQEAWGPRCQHCALRKVGCSLISMKWRAEKKEGKQRLVSEEEEENSAAPMMELSDGFMEQIEAMAKELRRISGGIQALVEGVGKLGEVMEQLEKVGVEKVEKKVETEPVQKVDKGMKTEILLEEESEDNSEEDKEQDEDKEMDRDKEK